jgi:hypothetical protein
MPKVGDLVIFGECDAPEAHCIGQITHKDGAIWHGKYMSKQTRKRYSGGLCDTMVTPVADFGVDASVSKGKLTLKSAGPSVAKYTDHAPRKWQETLPQTITI